MRTKLRKKALDKFGSVNAFADALGCSRQTVSVIFRDANLSQLQIIQMCEMLGIKRKEIVDYFFPEGVAIVKRCRANDK